MLAAEALSLEVDISTAKIDEVCSFGEGAPVLKLMWAPVTLGGFPSKLVPLVNLDSSTFTTHHPATRSSSLALCAANDQCALTVGVSPSSKVLQCRHCLRQFHSTCCSVADDSVPGNIWFCGCAYAAKNLRKCVYSFQTWLRYRSYRIMFYVKDIIKIQFLHLYYDSQPIRFQILE